MVCSVAYDLSGRDGRIAHGSSIPIWHYMDEEGCSAAFLHAPTCKAPSMVSLALDPTTGQLPVSTQPKLLPW
jgi:hypothetical protein